MMRRRCEHSVKPLLQMPLCLGTLALGLLERCDNLNNIPPASGVRLSSRKPTRIAGVFCEGSRKDGEDVHAVDH